MSSEPAVVVSAVSKTYLMYTRPYHRLLDPLMRRLRVRSDLADTYAAVENVSFEVSEGESVALLGRNGSGKSTTLQLVAGTIRPTAGRVRVAGRLSALLELGTGFNAEYTGRENLRLNAQILGMNDSEIDEVEPAIIRFADIGRFIDEPVRTYSSGMYVRLAFAVAVHVEPDVLIVDEALAVGDIFFQQKCADFLASKMAGKTKVVVTHDLTLASRLATRGIVFEQGRIVFDGPIDQAVRDYLTYGLAERSPNVDPESKTEGKPRPAARPAVEASSWFPVPASANSTTDNARVTAVAIRSAGHPEWAPALVVSPGERVDLRAECEVNVAVSTPILGVTVIDRTGVEISGLNSVGKWDLQPLDPGLWEFHYSFLWPEVADGEYTVTIGLGDGRNTHHHAIINWAQAIASFTSISSYPIHGLFNLDVDHIGVSPLEDR